METSAINAPAIAQKELVDRACLETLNENARRTLLVNVLVSVLATAVIWLETDSMGIFVWLAVNVVVSGVRFLTLLKFPDPAAPMEEFKQAARRYTIGAAAGGAVWGAAVIFLTPEPDLLNAFMIICLMGIATGASSSLSPHFPTFIAFVTPTLIPLILVLAMRGGLANSVLALMGGLFTIILIASAKTTNQTLRKSFEEKNNSDTLARALEKSRDALAVSEARFRDFAVSASDWFWETDSENQFTWFSHDSSAFRMMLGKRRWEIGDTDEKLTDWDPLKDALKTQQLFAEVEFCVLQQNGAPSWISANGQPLFAEDSSFLGYRGTARDITQQKAAAQVLRETNNRLQAITDTSPNIIVITRLSDGKITLANPATYTVAGYRPEEIIGRTAPNFYANSEDRNEYVRQLKENGSVVDFEVQLKKIDGSLFWTLVNSSVAELNGEPYIIAEIIDITARREVERELSKTANELKAILSTTSQGFWRIDNDARTMEVNPPMAEILGVSQQEAVGTTVYDFLSDEQKEFHKSKFKKRAFGESETYELVLTSASGNETPCMFNATPIYDEAGHKNGSFALVSDISSFIESQSSLLHAKEEAETANRAKSEFLSSMSHELRTPMNAILGFAQLLEYNPAEPLSDNQKSSVDLILKGGNHLLELIDQVLELSKIEAGKLSLNVDHVSARDVIGEGLQMIQSRADRDGIRIVDRCDKDDLPLLWTDGTRLTQVLLNLLSNAVKYNRENGTVTLSCQIIPDGMLRISVTDTGSGIPPEKQDDLFRPFERLGLETGTIEGTGIGLTITKQIIELLGGHIGFESEEGKGSTFWVDVPISEKQGLNPTRLAIATPVGKTIEESCETASQYVVLYVEDNPDNMQLMELLIGQLANTKLLTAYNAELGLDIARSERPDLILMDINLPGMNGIEALQQLRNMVETKDIPVIAVTAAAMVTDLDAGLKAGFKDYITKPINVPIFIRKIEETLDGIKKFD